MFPINGTEDNTIDDLRDRLSESVPTELDNKEYRAIINSFSFFVRERISSLEEPFFKITNFGDYRASPYELCYTLLKYRNIIKKIDSALKEGKRMSIPLKKIEQYHEDEIKMIRLLSIFSRIYGRTYMEKKFKEFKDLDIPEYHKEKKDLVNNKEFFDFTENEFSWLSDEELRILLK